MGEDEMGTMNAYDESRSHTNECVPRPTKIFHLCVVSVVHCRWDENAWWEGPEREENVGQQDRLIES